MDYNLITTETALRKMRDYYLEQDAFVFDVETMGKYRSEPRRGDVRWISFATNGSVDVIPMGHPNGELISERLKPNTKGEKRMSRGVAYEDLNPKYDLSKQVERFFTKPPEQLDRGVVMDALLMLFMDPDIVKVAHNIKFDLHAVEQFMPMPEGPYFDTVIASWLADTRRIGGFPLKKGEAPKGNDAEDGPKIRDGLSLKDCVWRELGIVMDKGVGEDITQHSFRDVARYSALDALRDWQVYTKLLADLYANPTMLRLMELEMQVLHPVLEMEATGVRIDEARLEEIRASLHRKIEESEGEIWKHTKRLGYETFNINSNKQKQELLYLPKSEGGLGIRPTKLTKSGASVPESERTIYHYSTDHWVMEANSRYPVIQQMLRYTAMSKILGTYVLPYTGEESRLVGGRIYAQFKQHGAESGRFSSANPNLQNIPSRSAEGREIREAFIPDEGGRLVVADYSQIEPRIIAALSGDPTMIATYRDGGDVYQAVADRMGVKRSAGKTLVLAIAYGVGPSKIANDIGCSVNDARDLMDYFAHKFPAIGKHKNKVVVTARRNQYSDTILGRRRFLPEIKSGYTEFSRRAERQAYNHLIQGSAADIMKIALVNVHAMLPGAAKMLMTVHDEVVITAPEDLADDVAKIVKQEMEASRPRAITVPLVADVKIVDRWSDAK